MNVGAAGKLPEVRFTFMTHRDRQLISTWRWPSIDAFTNADINKDHFRMKRKLKTIQRPRQPSHNTLAQRTFSWFSLCSKRFLNRDSLKPFSSAWIEGDLKQTDWMLQRFIKADPRGPGAAGPKCWGAKSKVQTSVLPTNQISSIRRHAASLFDRKPGSVWLPGHFSPRFPQKTPPPFHQRRGIQRKWREAAWTEPALCHTGGSVRRRPTEAQCCRWSDVGPERKLNGFYDTLAPPTDREELKSPGGEVNFLFT